MAKAATSRSTPKAKPTKPNLEQPATPIEDAPAPPSDEELAELGLIVEEDGLCPVKMLVGASGEGFSLKADDFHRCDPAMAVRWVRNHIARPKHRKA